MMPTLCARSVSPSVSVPIQRLINCFRIWTTEYVLIISNSSADEKKLKVSRCVQYVHTVQESRDPEVTSLNGPHVDRMSLRSPHLAAEQDHNDIDPWQESSTIPTFGDQTISRRLVAILDAVGPTLRRSQSLIMTPMSTK